MRFLASYVTRGRWQALLVTAVSALMTPLLPILSLLSGGVVSLIALKVGPLQALQLIGLALLVVMLLSLLLPVGPALALVLLLMVWLPVWGLSVNLRRHADQGRSVLLASLFGAMLVMVFHLSLESPADWWEPSLLAYFAPVIEQLEQAERAQFTQSLGQIATVLTGLLATGLAASLLLSLMLGRWWQAMLVNPGGFGEEFRALRLGRTPTLVILLVLTAAMLSGAEGLGQDLFMVAMLPFLVQGTALMHALVKNSGASRGWLFAMYLLLVLAGPVALLLAVAGALDNWFDFRAYASPKGGAAMPERLATRLT